MSNLHARKSVAGGGSTLIDLSHSHSHSHSDSHAHAHDSGHAHGAAAHASHDSGHAHAHDSGGSCGGHGHGHDSHHAAAAGGIGVVDLVQRMVKAALTEPQQLRLSLFTLAFFACCAFQFGYGVYAESLALIADACHMLFACGALLVRLVAHACQHVPRTPRYPYGARRVEVLLFFCAGASAIFISLFLLFESIEHFLDTPHVHGDSLLTVATVGLAVKIVGALFFFDYMRARAETELPYEQPGDQWRHVIVDAICSSAVMFNSWLITWHDGMVCDALVAFLIAALLIGAAVPVCARCGMVLLHTTPVVQRDALTAAERDSLLLDGVTECRAAHFWTLSPGVFAGSIIVRIRPNANRSLILSRVRQLFQPLATHLTVQLESDAQ